MERWPDLAAVIIERPPLMAEAEKIDRGGGANGQGDPGKRMSGLCGAVLDDLDDLIGVLCDEPSLATVTHQLVFALPQPDRARTSTSLPTITGAPVPPAPPAAAAQSV
jgi:hypothetical protein